MVICPNCKRELPDSAKFCGYCGIPMPKEAEVPAAELPAEELPAMETPMMQLPPEDTFAPEIPAENRSMEAVSIMEDLPAEPVPAEEMPAESGPIEVIFAVPADVPAVPGQNVPAAPKASFPDALKKIFAPLPGFFQKVPKLVWILGGAGIAVVLVLVLLVSLILGSRGTDNYVMYFKDGELCYSDFSKDGAMEVSDHMFTDDSTYAFQAGFCIAFSEDNSRMFFPSKTTVRCSTFTLNYRDLKDSKGDSERIASEVISYNIDAKGKQVVYIKGNNYTLHWTDLKDDVKIEKDVSRFYTNEDLSKVLYQTRDRELYLWTKDGDSERLARDVDSLEFVTTDLSYVFYMDGSTLMRLDVENEDEEELAENIADLLTLDAEQDGTFYAYYIKENVVEYNLMDYVDDPDADADAAIVVPEEPDYPDAPASPKYPYSWNYDSDEEYEAAMEEYEEAYEVYEQEYEEYEEICQLLYEEYEAAMERYFAKEDRDYLREALSTHPLSLTEQHLYYHNGSEETLVSDSYSSLKDYASNAPVLLISVYEGDSIPEFALSEISSVYDVQDAITEAVYSAATYSLVTETTVTEFVDEEAQDFDLSNDGKLLYYLSNYSRDGDEGDLFKITITDGTVGEPEEMDTDVAATSSYCFRFLDNTTFLYIKDHDISDANATFFLNGMEIADDVCTENYGYQDGSLLFFTDRKRNGDNEGTLNLWNGKEAIEIAEDVFTFKFTPEMDVVYLADFNAKRFHGDLFRYHNGKSQEVDTDVAAIITSHRLRVYGNATAAPVNAAPAVPAEAPAAAEAPTAAVWP